MSDLYIRCADALNISRNEFAAWVDGDISYNLDGISSDIEKNLGVGNGEALYELEKRGIITSEEFAHLCE